MANASHPAWDADVIPGRVRLRFPFIAPLPNHETSRDRHVPDLSSGFEEAGQQAVLWVSRHLDRLDPYVAGELTSDGIKALSEFGIVYSFLHDMSSSEPHAWIRDEIRPWRSLLVEQCGNPRYAQMPRKRPAQAFYLLMPYLALRATGYRDAYHEQTLRCVARWRYPEATEVVPHRLMDRQYFLWKAGCLLREPPWRTLYRTTSVPCMTHPQYVDVDGMYALTHTLFYLTDLGRRVPRLSRAELRHLATLAEYLAIHHWRLSQWDLLGELLVGLRGMQQHGSSVHAHAARAFRSAQDADGSVPPSGLAEADTAADKENDPALRFCHRYHTTFVMILCAFAHSGS